MKRRFSKLTLFLFSLIFLFSLLSINESELAYGESLQEVRSADGRYIDHGDGTITDRETGFMWTKKDSRADIGKCLNWYDSKIYVSNLRAGGYSDWRMPTAEELKTIYEKSKINNIAYTHNPKLPLHLDSIFADGAAYGLWTSELIGPISARYVYFGNIPTLVIFRFLCSVEGVRAVRLPQ